jgi:hypothetical protein
MKEAFKASLAIMLHLLDHRNVVFVLFVDNAIGLHVESSMAGLSEQLRLISQIKRHTGCNVMSALDYDTTTTAI